MKRADCVLLALPFPTGEVDTAHIADDRLFVAMPEGEPRDPPDEQVVGEQRQQADRQQA